MRFFILLTFVLFSLTALSQRDTIHIHYFPNGKISTFSYIDENRYGKAFAYNLKGEVIYENETRRIHGSAGVRFSHHANGMVKTAHYSSHPDGGIQWYRTTTTFNEKGEKISEIHDNYEGPGQPSPHILIETVPQPEKTIPETPLVEEQVPTELPVPTIKKEIVECASIHQNFVEVINHTNFSIKVTFIYQNKDTVIVLRSGEKIDGPTYISAEINSPLHQNMTFRYIPNRRKRNVREVIKSHQFEQYKTKHVVHLFESVIND